MALPIGKILGAFKPTNLIATVLLVGIGYAGLWVYRHNQRIDQDLRVVAALQAKQAELEGRVAALKELNQQLEGFVKRLTSRTRVATVRVLSRRVNGEGDPIYSLQFTEYDRQNKPLPTRTFDTVGKEVKFDALVIKFDDESVKVGDLLRGKSLHLFRRAYGDAQQPRNGPLIATDLYDEVPNVYRMSSQHVDFEKGLWRKFWYWTEHPEEAAAEGITFPQIEAVGTRPVVGRVYRLSLDHDGGMNIKAVPEGTKPAPPPKPTTTN